MASLGGAIFSYQRCQLKAFYMDKFIANGLIITCFSLFLRIRWQAWEVQSFLSSFGDVNAIINYSNFR
jgi:hypothetical protein